MGTGSVLWKWNETNTSQFGSGFAMNNSFGTVTGSVSMTVKSATGSMVNPSIRFDITDGFRTPSGSLYMIPIDNLSLPRAYRLRFFTDHYGANAATMFSSTLYSDLNWGFVVNASTGSSNPTNICGTYFWMPWFRDLVAGPRAVNEGVCGDRNASWSELIGMVSSSYTSFDYFFTFLSTTGSSLSGSAINASWIAAGDANASNETNRLATIDRSSTNYFRLNYSGSAFRGKILDKIYIAFCYNPSPSSYIPLTGAYVEIDSLAILNHPGADNRIELQPQSLQYSTIFTSTTPSGPYGSRLRYWTDGTQVVLTGSSASSLNRVREMTTYSGSTITFGNGSLTTSPLTGVLSQNSQNFSTVFFSGTVLTSSAASTVYRNYFSTSAHHTFFVARIITGSLNNALSYQNHIIFGDNSNQGVFYRNLGNGSGTINLYINPASASYNFKFGDTVMIEWWRTNDRVWGLFNNDPSTLVSGGVRIGAIDPSITSISMGSSAQTFQYHLFEMVVANTNRQNHVSNLGVANYLAAKYGFSTRTENVVISGEEW